MREDMVTMVPKSEQQVKKRGVASVIRSKRDVEIGARIKALREELGLSTRRFAEGVPGLRSSNLSDIERGNRRASSAVLDGIRRKYGASVDFLLTGKDPNQMREVGTIKARVVPVLGVDDAISYLFGEVPNMTTPRSNEYAPAVTDDHRAMQIRAEGPLAIRGVDTIFIEPGREVFPGDVVLFKDPGGFPSICRVHDSLGTWVLTNYANPSAPAIVLPPARRQSAAMFRVSGLFKRF